MRCLVTGASGFVGMHLIARLQRDGHTVLGMSRHPLRGYHPQVPLTHLEVDLLDFPRVAEAIHDFQPDWIFHLAGYASAGKSVREPDKAWAGNFQSTLNLYLAILECHISPRVLFIGSGLIYGDAMNTDTVFDELSELKPTTPYGTSKAAADLLSYQMSLTNQLQIIRARPFNHIGPGQSPDFAIPNFARQIASIELGLIEPVIQTGDLSSSRDMTDVRDVVDAYVKLIEQGRVGEAYNVGSGRSHRMVDLLSMLLLHSSKPIKVNQVQDPARKTDAKMSRASIQKIVAQTGWRPSVPMDQTLRDTLDDWKARLRNQAV